MNGDHKFKSIKKIVITENANSYSNLNMHSSQSQNFKRVDSKLDSNKMVKLDRPDKFSKDHISNSNTGNNLFKPTIISNSNLSKVNQSQHVNNSQNNNQNLKRNESLKRKSKEKIENKSISSNFSQNNNHNNLNNTIKSKSKINASNNKSKGNFGSFVKRNSEDNINKIQKYNKFSYFKILDINVFNYLQEKSILKIQRHFRNYIIKKYSKFSKTLISEKVKAFKLYKTNDNNKNNINSDFSNNKEYSIFNSKSEHSDIPYIKSSNIIEKESKNNYDNKKTNANVNKVDADDFYNDIYSKNNYYRVQPDKSDVFKDEQLESSSYIQRHLELNNEIVKEEDRNKGNDVKNVEYYNKSLNSIKFETNRENRNKIDPEGANIFDYLTHENQSNIHNIHNNTVNVNKTNNTDLDLSSFSKIDNKNEKQEKYELNYYEYDKENKSIKDKNKQIEIGNISIVEKNNIFDVNDISNIKDFAENKNDEIDMLEKNNTKEDLVNLYENMYSQLKKEIDLESDLNKNLNEKVDPKNYLEENNVINNNYETNEDKKSLLKRINKLLDNEELTNYHHHEINDSFLSKTNDNKDLNYKSSTPHFTNNVNSNDDSSAINNYQAANMILEIKELKKTIKTMKIVIEDQRKEIKLNIENSESKLSKSLNQCKIQYESKLKEQIDKVEEILAEKKKMEKLNEELADKIDSIERQYQKKINLLKENFEIEKKKERDSMYQLEKKRRKEWEQKKIEEIKQNTIKGLEPEVERILNNHKNEIVKIEDQYNLELKSAKERMSIEYEKRIKEIKDRCQIEKDEAIEHERKINSQRLRSQAERLEEEFAEERRRWNNNLNLESQRIDALRDNDKRLFESQMKKIEERNELILSEKEKHYKSKIDSIIKQYEDKLSLQEEDLRLKLEREKNNLISENLKLIEQKSRELKAEMNRDRDIQVKTVIEKLSEDTMNERKKIKEESERKAEELNSRLKVENEQLKQKMIDLTEKYSAEYKNRNLLDENLDSISAKYSDCLKELAKKDSSLTELNINYKNLSNRFDNILSEFNKEKTELENNLKIQLMKKDDELKMIRLGFEGKIKGMENSHKEELKAFEEKITKIIVLKDIKIRKLEDDLRTKEIENNKYSEMIDEMRNEYLKK